MVSWQHVGGILEMVGSGSGLGEWWGKFRKPVGNHRKPMGNARILCLIDSYDDLLLSGHRLLAQLPVFASGEHFENIFRDTSKVEGVCTVVLCTFL